VSDPISAIADAVLYEGYILWPYRRSALKNQRRFTFGGVYPPAHSAEHPDDPCTMRTEVLLTGDDQVEVTVRFLQVVERTVLDPAGRAVDQLEVDGERYLTWREAVEREVRAPGPIAIAAGSEREAIGQGSLVRNWDALEGAVDVASARAGAGVRRLTVTIRNETPSAPTGSREEALKRTFCSTHTLLRVRSGEFVSMADPPPELAELAGSCTNVGTWPTLVGEPGERTTMLSSPIILDDYPSVAPESPGDLFDGGEIDQLLILNILALTDEEKAEMAASDPRARRILERTEALTPAELMALHGTIREFGLAR
jgi:hydrogenase maturation protease